MRDPIPSKRPDVPHVGLFNRHADAVAEASFRAAVSGHRQRVKWEPNNRWWQITDAWPNTRVYPPAQPTANPDESGAS